MPLGAILLDNNHTVIMNNELALDYCREIQKSNSLIADPIGATVRFAFSNLQCEEKVVSVHSLSWTYQFSIFPMLVPDSRKGVVAYFMIYIKPFSPTNSKAFAVRASEYKLTEREIEIVELISKGLTNKEISAKLFISYNTVRTHVENIIIKLGVTNRTAILFKLGIINTDTL